MNSEGINNRVEASDEKTSIINVADYQSQKPCLTSLFNYLRKRLRCMH